MHESGWDIRYKVKTVNMVISRNVVGGSGSKLVPSVYTDFPSTKRLEEIRPYQEVLKKEKVL